MPFSREERERDSCEWDVSAFWTGSLPAQLPKTRVDWTSAHRLSNTHLIDLNVVRPVRLNCRINISTTHTQQTHSKHTANTAYITHTTLPKQTRKTVKKRRPITISDAVLCPQVESETTTTIKLKLKNNNICAPFCKWETIAMQRLTYTLLLWENVKETWIRFCMPKDSELFF